jgi:serine/threonine protein kinase
MNEPQSSRPPESFGRYLLYPAIARGGMATVHTARLVGAEGFTRLVAAKRLHPQFTDDPDFVTMFHDEACIASRIHHPNVVPVLDVVVSGTELILVQEYVHGVPLSQLMKVAQVSNEPISIDIAIAVLTGILAGLHGAHEVKDEGGTPLEIVHRDVSPANVMISVEGVPRLLDFGIAKARTSTHHTREGVFKGKLAYMAPEQLRMDGIDRTVDIYAAGILAWELLVNRRVYDGRHELAFVTAVMNGEIPSITAALADARHRIDDARWKDLVALEPVIARAMAIESADRFATAEDMMRALHEVRASATSMVVASWVRDAGADFLDKRQKTLASNEESWRRTSLYTPSSGMQRVTSSSMMPTLPDDGANALQAAAYGGVRSGASGNTASMTTRISSNPSPPAPNSLPGGLTSGTAMSAAHPNESGAFRRALGVSPLATFGRQVRRSRMFGPRYLPWICAGLFVVAGLVGGLWRSGLDASPEGASSGTQGNSGSPNDTVTLPVLPSVGALGVNNVDTGGAGGSANGAPAATATAAPVTPPPTPSAASSSSPPQPAVQWRTFRAPPPPAPPPPQRGPLLTRSSSPPATASSPNATSPSPNTSSKSDCNPPFFYEGTKKVFKPSCL